MMHPVVHLVPISLSPRAHLPHTPRVAPLRSDDELRRAGRIIKNHMETRFTQIRKAFRTMDEDEKMAKMDAVLLDEAQAIAESWIAEGRVHRSLPGQRINRLLPWRSG